jgi:hypothetical protein
MTQPTTRDEFLARFKASQMISILFETGELVENFPCPFCAAPNWTRLRLDHRLADVSCEARCRECGRSARGVPVDTENGKETFYIVQTSGPAPPEYWG